MISSFPFPRDAWRFATVAGLVVVADQISKYFAVIGLTHPLGASADGFGARLSRFLFERHPLRGEPVAVLDDFWHWRYAENPGAAWSFLATAPEWFRKPFFLAVPVAAMVFIAIYAKKSEPEQGWLRFALALVFGGALGNFLDRVRLGYVIDFIDWHWFDKATWPTFNIADAGISIGVAMMIAEMLFKKPQPKGV